MTAQLESTPVITFSLCNTKSDKHVSVTKLTGHARPNLNAFLLKIYLCLLTVQCVLTPSATASNSILLVSSLTGGCVKALTKKSIVIFGVLFEKG